MNTGLQDAFNLGWKLALVCRGSAGEGLLDTYETERRPVAVRVVESGAAAEASHSLAAAEARAERDSTIRKTFSDPETAHHEAAAAAEIDRSYAGSPIVVGDPEAGAGAGRVFRTASTSTHRPPATPPSSTSSHTGPGTSWSSSAARRPTPRPWPRSWPRWRRVTPGRRSSTRSSA